MSWAEHDEFIDLARGRHVVVYRNKDTGQEHHLVNLIHLDSCPHCGAIKQGAEPADFAKLKADTLAQLRAHHKILLQYREKHPYARLGTEPKK